MNKFSTDIHSEWLGFSRIDFQCVGHPALVVRPHVIGLSRPWIWRTEFFGHEPQLDIALLELGWHVAYLQVRDMYGAPPAIADMEAFRSHLATERGFVAKPVLEGMSRGGLYAFNYAAAYPEKVAALYLDNPVLDIRSWPGGQGKGLGSPEDWRECAALYGLTPETETTVAGPLDRIEPVVAAKIPIVAVCGDADEVVPFEENTAILEKRYRQLGAPLQLILKAGFKHHPHSLVDVEPLVQFFREHLPSSF